MLDDISPKEAGVEESRLEGISDWLSQQISKDRLAGCSVLVGRRGRVVYFGSTGMSDKEAGKRFQRDTIVRIFSMTKPITTVAAMMLYEKGAFQLDDRVSKYLPEFAETPVWKGGKVQDTEVQSNPMLVRHLMTHTSGLTYGFMQSNVIDERYRKALLEFKRGHETLEDVVNRLAKIPLIYQPGSQWNYSVSIDVLGRLVEIWSGMTLEDFICLLYTSDAADE